MLNKKYLLIAIAVVFIVAAAFFLRLFYKGQPSTATSIEKINLDSVSDESTIDKDAKTLKLDLYSEDSKKEPLDKLSCNDVSCVIQFLNKPPHIDSNQTEQLNDESNTQVKGVSTENISEPILPTGIAQNLSLWRTGQDNGPKRHYYFTQVVGHDRLPVLGADLQIHLDGNNVYALKGNLTTSLSDNSVKPSTITNVAAEKMTLDKAASETTAANLQVCSRREAIINYKVLGVSGDESNYETTAFNICNGNPATFSKTYYIGAGGIMYQEEKILDGLTRQIYVGQSSTPKRKEGDGPANVTDVDNAYDVIGSVYNFYLNTFQRDSYNNRGGAVRVYTAIPDVIASWSVGADYMLLSPGMAALDVMAHEFTHGVTEHTAALQYQNQSGSLNEGMSDIFGWALDSDNWTMGEKSSIGAIRSLKDPTQFQDPDKLFSQYYYCGGEQNKLVHTNSNVMNHGFYLMVEGGSFNGCQLTGIGKDKAIAVAYKALTTYLRPTSNFKDAYTSFLDACRDLYGAGSSDCESVKRALQAVEMDQQTAGSQVSVSCPDKEASAKKKTPECVNPASGEPTVEPTAGPTNLPTSEPLPTKDASTTPFPDNPLKSEQYEEPCTLDVSQQSVITPHRYLSFECADGRSGRVGDGSCQLASKLREVALSLCENRTTPEPTLPPRPTSVPTQPGACSPNAQYCSIYGCGDPCLQFTDLDSCNEYRPLCAWYACNNLCLSGDTNLSCVCGAPQEGISLSIFLKFQGVTHNLPFSGPIKVSVGLVGEDLADSKLQTVPFFPQGEGIWLGRVNFAVDEGDYCVLVKGPYHMQKKICDEKPTEKILGGYKAGNTKIHLSLGTDLNFSNILLLSGDLKPQDGVVNSYDTSLCQADLGRYDEESLSEADINLDGVVNAQDCALIYTALATNKYDEE